MLTCDALVVLNWQHAYYSVSSTLTLPLLLPPSGGLTTHIMST